MSTLSRRRFVNLMGCAGGLLAAHQIGARASLTPALVSAAQLGSSDSPAFKTAIELTQMIRDKEISSVELTQYFIDRIDRFAGQLNAIIVRDFDRALEAARVADAALL